jgi:hypothetical protein
MRMAPPERLSFALYKIEQRALRWLHDVTRGRVFLIPRNVNGWPVPTRAVVWPVPRLGRARTRTR